MEPSKTEQIHTLQHLAKLFRLAPREGNEADEAEWEGLYCAVLPEPIGRFSNKAAIMAADALEAAAKALEAAE